MRFLCCTFVFRALHVRVPPVTRTCSAFCVEEFHYLIFVSSSSMSVLSALAGSSVFMNDSPMRNPL